MGPNGKCQPFRVTLHEHSPTPVYRFAKRFYLPLQLFKPSGISTGDLLILRPALSQKQLSNLSIAAAPPQTERAFQFAIGVAWPSTSLESDAIAISVDHLASAGVQIGDFITIIPLPPILSPYHVGPGKGIRLPAAKTITLQEITTLDGLPESNHKIFRSLLHQAPQTPAKLRDFNPSTDRMREAYIREVLVDRKYLAINHYISVPFANRLRLFLVQDIQRTAPLSNSPSKDTPAESSAPPSPSSSPSSSSSLELFVIDHETELDFSSSPTGNQGKPCETPIRTSFTDAPSSSEVKYDAIGGLDSQIEQIRELVELPLLKPDLYSHFGLIPPRGILLHGPPGTGKTLLASIIAESLNCTTLRLTTSTISSSYHGVAEQAICGLFETAKLESPSVIIIDEVETLFPNREEGEHTDRRIVGALLSCMDGIDEKAGGQKSNEAPRVVVIATTNRPNDLDPALRRPGRFDREFEIGIPDSSARFKILKVLLNKTPHDLSDETIKLVADKAHGFVGADLASLIREAGMIAIKRAMFLMKVTPSISMDQFKLDSDDINKGLLKIRPSGMREVYVETPKVTWADIGGQVEIKQRMIEAVEWSSKYAATFKRLGIQPVRGILLYGPPGCSKTLIGKALAFESNKNFITLKCSDVFSKWFGDSEKAIRDVFRKARAAAPSIVFLDEVDSIAMARGGADEDNSVTDRVLTSLLVELDGIEELNGVLVLAATNRPHVIDPALMRPGRIDRILYVGLPDLDARIEIFKINFKKMTVSEQISVDNLAFLTEGYTGAEIVSICQEAAINAMHRDLNVQFIEEDDFLNAIKKLPRRTDPAMLDFFQKWSENSGLRSA